MNTPPIDVSLRHSSVVTGDHLVLSITGHPRSHETKVVGVDIFELGSAETGWVSSPARAKARRRANRLQVFIQGTEALASGKTFEIRQVSLFHGSEDEAPLATLVGGRDFPRIFFETVDRPQQGRSPSVIRLAAYDLEEHRRVDLARPLVADSAVSRKEFKVLSFVEGCLLTRPIRLTGFEVHPVGGNGSRDEALLLNRALSSLAWPANLKPDEWASFAAKERPVILFHFPRVLAETRESAIHFAVGVREQVLDLLALHRGARGNPLALFVAEAGTQDVNVVPEFQNYTGNLLGGFLSGEDPEQLSNQVGVVQTQPLISLFLSLFKDSLLESEPDFTYLRYWNLLEVMSGARIQVGLQVTDFAGNELLDGTEPARTDKPRGRVYQLLKSRFQPANFAESNFTAQPNETLWSMTGVWYGYRHAAGHHGRFRPQDPAQVAQPWYSAVNGAHEFCSSSSIDPRNSPYLLRLRSVVEWMLRAELNSVANP